MKYLLLLFLFSSNVCLAQSGRRISKVLYYHSTVGTTAQDAIPSGNVDSRIVGWRICHDSDSTANYLAVSVGIDPAVDGLRFGPDGCYTCDECGSQGLLDLNVKADTAATGYSVIQFK